jgi:hypothetical protein
MVNMIEHIQVGETSIPAYLSALGGISIILGSLSLFVMLMSHEFTSSSSSGPWQIYSISYPYWLAFMASMSVLVGTIIIYASYKMYRESGSKLWKILIVLGSIVGLIYMREFGLGGILSLTGGLMGLWSRKGLTYQKSPSSTTRIS